MLCCACAWYHKISTNARGIGNTRGTFSKHHSRRRNHRRIHAVDDVTVAGRSVEASSQAVLHPAGVEPLPPTVQFGSRGAQGVGRAYPLPTEERLLPQERRGQDQGPQILGAPLRGGQVQHPDRQLPLRNIRLHHAGRHSGQTGVGALRHGHSYALLLSQHYVPVSKVQQEAKTFFC